jgi:hypothetical protein
VQRFVDWMQGRADPDRLDVQYAIEALAVSIATPRSLEEAREIATHATEHPGREAFHPHWQRTP